MGTTAELSNLPTSEKLRLVAALWDSIDNAEIRLSDEQWQEINRRMQATDSDPSTLVSQSEMRKRLKLAP